MAVETVQNEKEKIKVSPQGWLALVIMLCMFSGFFANMEGPLQFLRASGMEKSWIIPVRSGRSKGRRYMNAASG